MTILFDLLSKTYSIISASFINENLVSERRSEHIKLLGDCNNIYFIIPTDPVTGVLYVTQNNPEFISGQVRMRGRKNGSYPYKYQEMINSLFAKEENTIEVCSGSIGKNGFRSCFTVDINPETEPDLVSDGQTLSSIPNDRFNRWQCDPPYNTDTARTELTYLLLLTCLKPAPEFVV